jgi:hypothetical protein
MTARCPSDLALESHLLDPDRSPIAPHVAACPRCAERLERMRAEGEEFAARVFPATVDAVEEAAARRPWWRRPAFALPIPVLAAFAAAVLLLRPSGPPEDYVGLKGGAGGLGLTLFTPGPAGVGPVLDGAGIAARASIRFRVRTVTPCHLWIASVDASGNVSRLYPAGGGGGAYLLPGEVDLPGGAVLDGGLGPERLYAICTPHTWPWGSVHAELVGATSRPATVRRPAPLGDLPTGSTWTTLLLEKQP